MEQANGVKTAGRRISAYVVRCIDGRGRRFQFHGLFGNDWEAIDSALGQGAVFASPRRQGVAGAACGSPATSMPS